MVIQDLMVTRETQDQLEHKEVVVLEDPGVLRYALLNLKYIKEQMLIVLKRTIVNRLLYFLLGHKLYGLKYLIVIMFYAIVCIL